MTITVAGRFKSIAVAAGLLFASAAHADNVPGVYSTGFGPGGAALNAGNGQADANYVLTATTGPAPTGTQAVTFYNPNYVADSATSRWISYTADTTKMSYNALFTFTTTFDLTGFDAGSASLSGLLGADNEVTVLLNGTKIGGLYGYTRETFNHLTTFGTTDGSLFVNGVNRLDVELHNIDLIAAVRVDQLVVNASLAGVPEPATWALMVLGFGAIGGTLRRRHRQVAALA
ncbi:PEPxxWA-CTERM sorting domain-containing protein [Sphingomonas sp.]|uniref:PEPxxWA-CTERM sorting domain-containing protein n=1 Tax=Sphingomonas sp. TaxID=28214 RepID=UPI003AFFB2DA